MSAPNGQVDCFDFDSLYIQQLLSDTSAGITLGNVTQAHGSSELGLKTTMLESESYGDGQILDDFARIKALEIDYKVVVLDLPSLEPLLGANIQTLGSSPNRQMVAGFNTAPLPYFTMDGQCKYTGFGVTGGDLHVILAKCKVKDFSYKLTAEKRHELSGKAKGIPLIYKDPTYGTWIWKFLQNETAANVSATSYSGAAPAVSSIVPAASATGQATNTAITITFNSANAPLNPGTVNGDHFVLFDVANDSQLPCTVSLDSTGFIVTLQPVSALTATHSYEVMVTTGVRDIYGNALATLYHSGFSC